jgi:hypothetical protein
MAKKAMHNIMINAKTTAPTAIPAFASVDIVGFGIGVGVGVAVPLLEVVVLVPLDEEIRSVSCHRIDNPISINPQPWPRSSSLQRIRPEHGSYCDDFCLVRS